MTPCESWPARLASTSDSATTAARSGGVPAATRMDSPRRRNRAAENVAVCSVISPSRPFAAHPLQLQAASVTMRPLWLLAYDPHTWLILRLLYRNDAGGNSFVARICPGYTMAPVESPG